VETVKLIIAAAQPNIALNPDVLQADVPADFRCWSSAQARHPPCPYGKLHPFDEQKKRVLFFRIIV